MRLFLRWSSFFDQYLGSAAITIPSPTWACFWQLIVNSFLPLDCIRERWPDNKGKVHKLLWIKWLGPLWPTGFGSITTHNLLFSCFLYKQISEKKMSQELLQLHCSVIIQQLKLRINVIKFFSPSNSNPAFVFFS